MNVGYASMLLVTCTDAVYLGYVSMLRVTCTNAVYLGYVSDRKYAMAFETYVTSHTTSLVVIFANDMAILCSYQSRRPLDSCCAKVCETTLS
jgi:hypothetical protein